MRRRLPLLVLFLAGLAGGCSTTPPADDLPLARTAQPSANALPLTDTCAGYPVELAAPGTGRQLQVMVRVCDPAEVGYRYWIVVEPAAAGRPSGTVFPLVGIDASRGGPRTYPVTLPAPAAQPSGYGLYVIQVQDAAQPVLTGLSRAGTDTTMLGVPGATVVSNVYLSRVE